MRIWTNLPNAVAATLAALLTFACQDNPDVAANPDTPEPGDPGLYAPPGWPLEIGDQITHARYNRLREDFVEYRGLDAIHAVGEDVYSARFRNAPGLLPEEKGLLRVTYSSHWVYEGHFPGKLARVSLDPATDELELPPELRGKIKYAVADERATTRHPPRDERGFRQKDQ